MLVPTGHTGFQNAPDEAAHVAYVRSLAAGHLPSQRAPLAANQNSAASYEWHQPPLYYVLAAAFSPLGDRAMRLASVLCGLAAICLIFRIVRLVFPERPVLATLAAGIAALTPTHIAITSVVNNDALLEVCFSATLVVLAAAFRGGFTKQRAIFLGIGIGCAILTKATGLLLVPISLFGLFLLRRTGESPLSLVRGAAISFVTILTLTGWWFIRNQVLYGELLPIHGFAEAFAGTMTAERVVRKVGGWSNYLLMMGAGIFQSFWAVLYGKTPEELAYGVPRFLPDRVYLILAGVCLTAAGGMPRLILRRRVEFTESQRSVIWILIATVVLVSSSFIAFILKYFQMQGRYLYPAMSPICSILALGWLSVFPPRYHGVATALLLTLLFGFCILFLVAM
jgi:4-amino-4-deoxy-L-arabinose transferase-like glycosyltransferase